MSQTDLSYLNVAGYKFVDLDESAIRGMRYPIRDTCRSLGIRGTIILSVEGINAVLSGLERDVRSAIDHLRAIPAFSDLHFKESWSSHVAFTRMLVKVKREIISTGIEGLRPPLMSAPYIKPTELKRWYDEGRDFVILDTRNNYEVEVGTFQRAMHLDIDDFRSFPTALDQLDQEIRGRPVVTFCTGGIRCEKAAPLMLDRGFSEVYQLEGGILEYFEQLGGQYYDGECFVFDQRVAVDGDLKETETTQCFACQHPLTPEDQRSSLYVVGRQCPHCARQ